MANVLLIVYIHLIFSNFFHLSYTNGFREEPQDTVVNAGQTATLTCVISNRSSASILHVYWFKSESSTATASAIAYRRQALNPADPGKYVVNGNGYNYSLKIMNTNFKDSAYYYCSVSALGVGYVQSSRARLDIYDPDIIPTCSFHTSECSLDVGDNVTIKCLPSTAATTPQFLWKGHVRLTITRGRNGSLTHEFQLHEEDRERPYTCTPSDTYPDVNNCTVFPLPQHTINLTPRTATTELGGTVEFSCEASGSPPFNQFIWVVSLDGKKVQRMTESSVRFIVSSIGDSGKLTITDLIISDNNTAVSCEVTDFRGDRLCDSASMFIRPGSSTETSLNLNNTVGTPTISSWSVPVAAIIIVTITVATLIVHLSLLCWWKFRSTHRQESCLASTQRESSQQNAASTFENDPGSTSIYSTPTHYSSHIYNDSDPRKLSKHQNKTSDDIQLTSDSGRTLCRRILQDDEQTDDISSVALRNEPFLNEPDEGNSSYAVVPEPNVAQDNYVEITE